MTTSSAPASDAGSNRRVASRTWSRLCSVSPGRIVTAVENIDGKPYVELQVASVQGWTKSGDAANTDDQSNRPLEWAFGYERTLRGPSLNVRYWLKADTQGVMLPCPLMTLSGHRAR